MFNLGEIWAYPTDTSFGLGVRADDKDGLHRLRELKSREKNMFFSLMVRDMEMLKEFAEIPAKFLKISPNSSESGLEFLSNFLTSKPRTVILKPTFKLPKSEFWPKDKVAFRVCTIPEISREIDFPITATSANISGKPAIYSTSEIREIFKNKVRIFEKIEKLPIVESSEIWDFTVSPEKRIR